MFFKLLCSALLYSQLELQAACTVFCTTWGQQDIVVLSLNFLLVITIDRNILLLTSALQFVSCSVCRWALRVFLELFVTENYTESGEGELKQLLALKPKQLMKYPSLVELKGFV